jgi:quercetin dioxygenase-like cupin family protein
MQEKIKQIAARIKEMREIFGVTLETLATEFNVTKEQYQDYENGLADIPVSILYKIAHRFNVELTSLITGEEPRLHTYALTRKGKGVSVERSKEYKYQNLAFNFVHKKVEPFLVTVEPESSEKISFNSHPGQEFNYVLEGSLKVFIDQQEIILNEGDTLFFDSSINHGMKALNGKTAKFLAVIS